jgi:2-methylisocitrate lyase-like PEP mutase family enzyme
MPIGIRASNVIESIKELRRLAEKSGRDPKTVSVTIFGTPADEKTVEQYRAAGVERVTFGLPPAGRDSLLPLMDRYAEFARKMK